MPVSLPPKGHTAV
ncbi:hypothetical protein F383_18205 [Gossypium arboreum]|uniref:Uncharacterized protein n=1 Tax=Gossypium arboreum TaxID=29729 RepID=A0A0B0NQS0_GOSAR|nr:hypothetical protein F383_18205 [Gossypium arboreum]